MIPVCQRSFKIFLNRGDIMLKDLVIKNRSYRGYDESCPVAEEQLRKYVFYLNVKHIEPTYIEVYHNKKRPDETIRLNW